MRGPLNIGFDVHIHIDKGEDCGLEKVTTLLSSEETLNVE